MRRTAYSHTGYASRFFSLQTLVVLITGALFFFPSPVTGTGPWGPLGGGLIGSRVDHLHVWDGKLIVAGHITTAGGVPVKNIAMWDGTQWAAIGDGWRYVSGLATLNGQLAVFGLRPDSTESEIGVWDGSSWVRITDVTHNGFCVFNGKVYQTYFEWPGYPFGTSYCDLLELDGTQWWIVKTWYGEYHQEASGLTVIAGELFVNVYHPSHWSSTQSWDGVLWTEYGWSGLREVVGFAKVNGVLYAAGYWPGYDAGVRYWDGNRWRSIFYSDTCYPVRALIAFNGELVMAGYLSRCGLPATGIVSWSGGEWHSFDGDLNNGVHALAVYNGKLVAGGVFTEAGGMPVGLIAEYLGPGMAIAISYFSAGRSSDGVALSWRIAADEMFDGFHIYRTDADGFESRLTPSILPASTRSFIDRTAEPGNRYSYVLVAVGAEGGEVRSQPAEIELAPRIVELYQNTPNPFNPSTTIRFVVPERSRVVIDIFGPSGEKVRTLANSIYAPGEWVTSWDGTDEAGSPVASGVYYYRMRIGDVTHSRKMVLVK